MGLVLRVLGLAAAVTVAGSPPGARPDGELAFTLALAGNHNMGAICAAPAGDLKAARRLTDLGAYGEAEWSPDGQEVALSGGKGATHPIRVERSDAGGRHAVTSPRLANEDDSSPSWSPDGTRIAFARFVAFAPNVDYSRTGVWVVDLRTGRERQLTSGVLPNDVAWSPVGEEIAIDFGREFVLATPDGRSVRHARPTDGPGGIAWSPDGQRLALGGGAIVDPDGHELGRFAPPPTDAATALSPGWSPDGAWIAFTHAATGYEARTNTRYFLNADLFVVPAGGGTPVALTRTPDVDEAGPAWRPKPAAGRAGTRQRCMVTGTPQRDRIRGTARDDLIDARGGNDVVSGGRGSDFVLGGPGDDRLEGGPGSDVLRAGPGNDRLHARDGAADRVNGGAGRDRAWVDRKDSLTDVERVFRR